MSKNIWRSTLALSLVLISTLFMNCSGFQMEEPLSSDSIFIPEFTRMQLADDIGGAGFVNVSALKLTNVAVWGTASYPTCPTLPVRLDVWRLNGTQNQFHNRCYSDESKGHLFCSLSEPVETGDASNQMLVRFWAPNTDCRTYAEGSNYVDHRISTAAEIDGTYTAVHGGRVMSAEQRSYEVRIDRGTGAIFEIYSKRAGRKFNLIHANVGAASQFAFHDSSRVLMANACGDSTGGVDYWNPNQAGAYCQYRNGAGSHVVTQPNSTTSQSRGGDGAIILNTAAHNMMNWAYGEGYEGPWNSGDNANLQQTISAHPDYFTVDATFINQGATRPGFIETPAFYLNAAFRKIILYPKSPHSAVIQSLNAQGITSTGVTENLENIPNPSGLGNGKFYQNYAANFISFQHETESDQRYTLAWFIAPELKAAKTSLPSVQLANSPVNVKFGTYYSFRAESGRSYRFKYAVFPFAADEVIEFRGRQMTVRQAINELKEEFEGGSTTITQAPPPAFATTQSQEQLGTFPVAHASDGNASTAWSSNIFQSSTNDRGVHLEGIMPNRTKYLVNGLLLTARLRNGQAVGFPRKYNVYVSDGSRWVMVGQDLTWQPDAQGHVLIPFSARSSHSALILPTELGRDLEGNHYFQMAEIRMVLTP